MNLSLLVLASACLACATSSSSAAGWREVTESERALSAPKVDPSAGAEYLFVEIEADDDFDAADLLVTTESRLKVFDDNGVERARIQEVLIPADAIFDSMTARVVHPDGTVTEIKPSDIHEREVERRGDLKRRVRSFAVPGLVPGSIVDLRHDVRRRDATAHGIPWILNQSFPAQQVRLRIRPIQGITSALSYSRTEGAEISEERGGFKILRLQDVPARPVEPLGVPFLNRLSWVVISYRGNDSNPKEFWREVSGSLHELSRERIKGKTRAMRAKARELTEGANSDEERLQRIYAFCVNDVRNRERDVGTLSRKELERLASTADPEQTLERREGMPWQINQLFASLATAAGFQASFALAGDRSVVLFERSMTNWLGLPESIVVIDTEAGRRYFNPGYRFAPFGQLAWEHEGGPVLLAHPREERFELIPQTPAERSVVTRKARLVLVEDGALEGDVEIAYAGHWSPLVKRRADGLEGTALADLVAADVAEALPRAQVSAVAFDHVASPLGDPVLRFRLRVPGYAEATGSRLIVEVNPFESQGEAPATDDIVLREYPTHTAEIEDLLARLPRLEAPTRQGESYVPFGFLIIDDIEVRLPVGYKLDRPSAPRGVVDLEAFRHVTGLRYDTAAHALHYRREVKLAANLLPASAYPALREVLTRIHEQDNHAMILKREDAVPSP